MLTLISREIFLTLSTSSEDASTYNGSVSLSSLLTLFESNEVSSNDFGVEREDGVDTDTPHEPYIFLVGVAPIDTANDFFFGLCLLTAELNVVPAAIFHLRSS